MEGKAPAETPCGAGSSSGWEDLCAGAIGKALGFLAADPTHNSLSSNEISDLSRKHGLKIFQSYLENNTPGAGRVFWTYGPDARDITVLAVEPHPEDEKRGAYERLKLSSLPPSSGKAGRKG